MSKPLPSATVSTIREGGAVRVLITGAAGQLGQALIHAVPKNAQVQALDRGRLDITDAAAVAAAVREFQPTVIINAAAYTAVDKAEQEPEAAFGVNALAPKLLAQAARSIADCRMIHVSTDYVFDGASSKPYAANDATHPVGVYGQSKRTGEEAVLAALEHRAVVLRTAWLYGAQGRNFLHTMLRLMRERVSVRVVADQIGTPTSTASLAKVIWAMVARSPISGLQHWTDGGVASWYDFAVAIAEEALVRGLLNKIPEVIAISTAEFPTPARRPALSVLDKTGTIVAVGFAPHHWRISLRAVLDELAELARGTHGVTSTDGVSSTQAAAGPHRA